MPVSSLDNPARFSLRGGRYAITAQLGAGAQGTTWAGMDLHDGRAVAIKRFDVRGAREWKDVELAEREAQVLAALRHPKLPQYIEHFEEDGVLYLVMERIDGQPLSELRKKGTIAEADVTRLLRDADEVLAYLQNQVPPVVHRDLKPSNVIRRADGSFAFVDFGSVCDRLRPEGGSTVVGTFGYMAPEQFLGRAGPGSDVYAIGATAVAMLTAEEPERWPRRGLQIDVDAALGGRVTAPLRHALRRMLEIDPDTRPTRIGPLLDAGQVQSERVRMRHAEFDLDPGAGPQNPRAARYALTLPVLVIAVAFVATTGLWRLLIFAAFAAILLFVVVAPVALIAFFFVRILGFGFRRDDWKGRGRQPFEAGYRVRVADERRAGAGALPATDTAHDRQVTQEAAMTGSQEATLSSSHEGAGAPAAHRDPLGRPH